MESDKLVESVKFLLNSIRQISDQIVDTNESTSKTLSRVDSDILQIKECLTKVEVELQNLRDRELIDSKGGRLVPELPVRTEKSERIIPALNLSIDLILDVYQATPALLEPFSRPLSLSGRTLSGAIDEIELETFAQGMSWIIETRDGDWILVPRPGILQRQSQLRSLSRLFDIESDEILPAELELLMVGTATAVEHGRRWYLKQKGVIGIHSDPLQRSVEQRLRTLEEKILGKG